MPAILQRCVILKMSTDKDNTKSEETMGDEKDVKEEEKSESKADTDGKDSEESENKEKETPKKRTAKVKEVKKQEVSEDEEENGEDEGGTENDASTKVPLLDQPLQLSGTRERKKVQRFTEEFKSEAKDTTIEIPEGKGASLGSIPRIDAEIQRTKADGLKALHKVLFGRVGKSTLVKKNIRKFNGFDFDKDSDLFEKKKAVVQKMESKVLKSLCGILDLEKKGNREDQAERIVTFLLEPKDSGKPVPAPRPKRKSAVKANSKGYSESEDDEKRPARSQRGKSKRANLKEDSSSESEEETSSQKKKNKKKQQEKESDKEKESEEEEKEEEEEEEEAEENDESASDSDEPKSKKKGKTANAKKATPKKSAKKPASKKVEKKPVPKRKKSTSKSDVEEEDSSSEDEPLAKKAKNPPTDDEIKAYVKEILEGANLEEITMKTVCKQVYAHYPEFDLAHKKDFIKSTVKSRQTQQANAMVGRKMVTSYRQLIST